MKHTPSFQLLKLDKIKPHNDLFHLIHHNLPLDETLLSSIKTFGIMQPLLVMEIEGSLGTFHLLSGFKRLHAAIELKEMTIPCLVLPRQTEAVGLYQYIALHKHLDNNVSPIEAALLLKQAQQHVDEQGTLSLLNIMGYKPNKHQLSELLSLLQLEKSVVARIHMGKVTPKTGKKLQKLNQEDQHILVRFIDKYNFGGSKQQNFVQMVIELAKRKQCSIEKILGNCGQQDVTDTKNIPQQGNQLLDNLQQQCTPELVKAEKAFQQRMQQLHLPDHFQLRHSLSFEKDSCDLSITFEDFTVLESNIDALKAMIPATSTMDTP